MAKFCECASRSGIYGDYDGKTPIEVCADCDREVREHDVLQEPVTSRGCPECGVEHEAHFPGCSRGLGEFLYW